MNTFEQFVNEGISFNDGKFAITKADNPDDIIYLNAAKLVKTTTLFGLQEHVYHYAYEFTSNAPSTIRTKFFNALRFDTGELDKADKDYLVSLAIKLFVDELKRNKINAYNFGSIVYPRSRSSLNREIISRISRTHRCTVSTFEVIKSATKDIQFNFDKFIDEVLESTYIDQKGIERPRYTEKVKKEMLDKATKLLNDIRNSEYFSVAESVKSNLYKPYFYNYFSFEDDREARTFKAISEAKAILVVDDVTTTGSTLVETVRTIRALNVESPIVIFTIVGKQQL